MRLAEFMALRPRIEGEPSFYLLRNKRIDVRGTFMSNLRFALEGNADYL